MGSAGYREAVSLQGHYAGAVTRLAAFALDQAVATASFTLTVAVAAWTVSLVTNGEVQLDTAGILIGMGAFALWLFVYYAYPWSVSGKSLGMSVLGIQVVAADGDDCSARSAVLRTLALPLSFLTLGLGFLPILFGRNRRALHDRIAGTAVVYSWDARAARWRFLARDTELGAEGRIRD